MMKKRIISLLLMAVMLVGLFPTAAGAAETDPQITNVSMTLDSILDVNFKVNPGTAADMSGYKVKVTIGSESQYQLITEPVLEPDTNLYVYSAKLPAHKLPQSLKVELLDGDDKVIQTKESWTVAGYLDSLVAKDSKLAALADALENYGSYAAYFANADKEPAPTAPSVETVEAVTQELLKAYRLNVSTADSTGALRPRAGLYVDDACDIRIKFVKEAWINGGYTLMIDGEAVSVDTEAEGDDVVYEIGQIKPQNWGKRYNIQVLGEGDAVVFACSYGVLSYAFTELGKTTETQTGLQGLTKAMYRYFKEVESYNYLLVDDFEGLELDTTKWEASDGFSVSDGVLHADAANTAGSYLFMKDVANTNWSNYDIYLTASMPESNTTGWGVVVSAQDESNHFYIRFADGKVSCYDVLSGNTNFGVRNSGYSFTYSGKTIDIVISIRKNSIYLKLSGDGVNYNWSHSSRISSTTPAPAFELDPGGIGFWAKGCDPKIQNVKVVNAAPSDVELGVVWDATATVRPSTVNLQIAGTVEGLTNPVYTDEVAVPTASDWLCTDLPKELGGKEISYTATILDKDIKTYFDIVQSDAVATLTPKYDDIVVFEDFEDSSKDYNGQWKQHSGSSLSFWKAENGVFYSDTANKKVFYKTSTLSDFELKATINMGDPNTNIQILFGTDGDDSFENGEFYLYPKHLTNDNGSLTFYTKVSGSSQTYTATPNTIPSKMVTGTFDITLRVVGDTATVILEKDGFETTTLVYTISSTHTGWVGFASGVTHLTIDNVVIRDLSTPAAE